MTVSRYLAHYPTGLQQQVQALIDGKNLTRFLRERYPVTHSVGNDKQLRDYVLALKNRYLKQSSPLSNVVFDNKLHVVHNALGVHRSQGRIQGNKIKTKKDIRISSMFKQVPEAFLEMICVHELAHLKESEHNKAFYQLCCHMLPNYHQVEFDTRVYLTHLELIGPVYTGAEPQE